MNNIQVDIAKNYLDENEYIILYKIKSIYHAISIKYDSSNCSVRHLGEFSHIVQIPTSWVLLSYNWEQEISNNCLLNEINKQISLLK